MSGANISDGKDSPVSINFLTNKKSILKNILKECLDKSKKHQKKHSRYKMYDEVLGLVEAGLSAVSIVLLLSGYGVVLAVICNSGSFVLGRVREKLNYTMKQNKHNLSFKQYSNLARELQAILSKNHLTDEDIINIIDEINGKMALIQDDELDL